jgi:hypothetical protein
VRPVREWPRLEAALRMPRRGWGVLARVRCWSRGVV